MNELTQHAEELPAESTYVLSPVLAAHNDTVRLISLCEQLRDRRLRIYKRASAITLLTTLSGAMSVFFLTGRIAPIAAMFVLVGTSLLSVVTILCAFPLLTKPSRRQGEALKKLAETSDVNALGALWEAQTYTDKALRSAINEAMLRLLPQVKQQEPPLLTKQQIIGLSKRVRNSVDPKLQVYYDEAVAVASVKAAAEIGGEEAVKHFQAVLEVQDESARVQRIKAEVEKYLPALQARYERESKGEKLLRPASPTDSDYLLIPTTSAATSNTANLVRPLHDDKD